MSVQAQNRLLLKKLLLIVVLMLGFSFAMVPLYRQICEAIGINQTRDVNLAAVNTQVDNSRTVTVELIASTNRNMPWRFEPVQRSVQLHPGQMAQVLYRVTNTTDRPIVGQAVPSYGPAQAARYFSKLQCFCFSTQTLQPFETREMPVVFVVSRELPVDMDTITLAYTFFDVTAERRREG